MARLYKTGPWIWAIPQLVGFVVLLSWVDSASRPIIGIFFLVFLAILGITAFLYRRTLPQILPARSLRPGAFVPGVDNRPARESCSPPQRPLPPAPPIVAVAPAPEPVNAPEPVTEPQLVVETEPTPQTISAEPEIIASLPLLPAANMVELLAEARKSETAATITLVPPAPVIIAVIPAPEPVNAPEPITEPQHTVEADPIPLAVLAAPRIIALLPPPPKASPAPTISKLRVRNAKPNPKRPAQTPTNLAPASPRQPSKAVNPISKPRNGESKPSPKSLPPAPAIVSAPPPPKPVNVPKLIAKPHQVVKAEPIPQAVATAPKIIAPLPPPPAASPAPTISKPRVHNAKPGTKRPAQTPTNFAPASPRQPAKAAAPISKPRNGESKPSPKPLPPAPAIVAAPPPPKPVNRPKLIAKPQHVVEAKPIPQTVVTVPRIIAALPPPPAASPAPTISKPRARKPHRRRKSRLLTRASKLKASPAKKAALPLNIAREGGRLLIPLSVEGLNPAELDWMTNDLSFIASHKNWMDGLAQLLEKRPGEGFPRPDTNGVRIAASSSAAAPLIAKKPEVPSSNLWQCQRIPGGLRCFSQTRRLTDEENADLNRRWPMYRVDAKTVLSFFAPPAASWNNAFRQEPEAQARAHFGNLKGAPLAKIVSSLLNKSAQMNSAGAGVGAKADQKPAVIPSRPAPDDEITFQHDGRRIWFTVRGNSLPRRIEELSRECYRHLALTRRIRLGMIDQFGLKAADSAHTLFPK